MTFLTIATNICIGLLIGTEFAVSAFVNPILWKLDRPTEARIVRIFARNLGGVMPFWYVLSLLLLTVQSIVGRRAAGFDLLIAADGIWAAVIVLTLVFLVPINSRLAAMNPEEWTENTGLEHKKWDSRHRLRIAALVGAWSCFLLAIQV